MQIISIVYPMAAMVMLTFIVMYLMLLLRVKAVRTRKISPRYFKLNKGAEIPDNVLAVSQNYTNLLELPVFFYTVGILAIVLNQNVEYFVYHAWAFVIARYIHTYIHITYNHILHRLYAFAISGFILLSMWIKVLLIISS